MDGLGLARTDVEKALKSIYLTQDRIEEEGIDDTDEGLETLKEFIQLLLDGGSLETFLRNQDMVVPD